jgi:hypothetical protein
VLIALITPLLCGGAIAPIFPYSFEVLGFTRGPIHFSLVISLIPECCSGKVYKQWFLKLNDCGTVVRGEREGGNVDRREPSLLSLPKFTPLLLREEKWRENRENPPSVLSFPPLVLTIYVVGSFLILGIPEVAFLLLSLPNTYLNIS